LKTENHFKHLRSLIAKDDLTSALQYLHELLKQTPQLNEAIHHSGRFENITKQIRLGVVNSEDATLTINQIRVGLLDFISEIESQQENPIIKKEWDNAISIIDSKNVFGNIDEVGNVYIGNNFISLKAILTETIPIFWSLSPIITKR